jgi:hypothetical protein
MWVDLDILHGLTNMGFNKKLVVEALKQTDNSQENALNLLVNSPHLLETKDKKRKSPSDLASEVQSLVAMGFSESLALGTLQECNGNLEQAIEYCLSGKGVEAKPQDISSTPSSDLQQTLMNQNLIPENFVPVPNKDAMDLDKVPDPEAEQKRLKAEEEERKRQEAEQDLLRDFDTDEDSYLDLNLDEEEAVLKEYKALLQSL